jgi:hypothetical protein
MDGSVSGSRRLITRGNLDGIACAAVFLHHFPRSDVTFVTSPPTALKAVRGHGGEELWLADIALTPEIAEAMRSSDRPIILVDHHPSDERAPAAFIDLEASAAGLLHRLLGSSPALDKVVCLADLRESPGSELLTRQAAFVGIERLEAEATVLDFSWRLRVDDDAFRRIAARSLAEGAWPSEIAVIRSRWEAVLAGDNWARALDRVRREITVRGPLAVLDTRGKRLSLRGFGSRAVAEVAREIGCRYTVMLQDGGVTTTVSLRSLSRNGIDLGSFAGDFARDNGLGGGGHRSSAGARVPAGCADRLIAALQKACA